MHPDLRHFTARYVVEYRAPDGDRSWCVNGVFWGVYDAHKFLEAMQGDTPHGYEYRARKL